MAVNNNNNNIAVNNNNNNNMAVNNNNNNNLVSGKPGTSGNVEETSDKKNLSKEKESTYAKTSVLKHLLHRFTGANQ